MKLPGVISLRKLLPTCAIPNGSLRRVARGHVVEVDEDALRRLGAQVRDRGGVLDRPDVGLEHEVEASRLGERAALAAVGARDLAGRALQVLRPEAELAVAAVDHRVGEARDVARDLPDPRVHDDRGIEAHDVVALLDHRAPPGRLQVVLELHAERTVVPEAAHAAVDLAAGKHETPALGEADDDVHVRGRHGGPRGSLRRRMLTDGWAFESTPPRRSAEATPQARTRAAARPAARRTARPATWRTRRSAVATRSARVPGTYRAPRRPR